MVLNIRVMYGGSYSLAQWLSISSVDPDVLNIFTVHISALSDSPAPLNALVPFLINF